MKTSKIILTSFLGVIGLFLLSFLIQISPEHDKRIKAENLQFIKSELSGINLIVVKNGDFDLITGNKDSLIVGFNKDKTQKEPVYKISGDTLFITETKNADIYITNVSCRNVKEIILDHSNAYINDTLLTRLKLKGNTSNIYLSDNKIFSFLSVDLTDNSNVYGNSVKIDTLQILSKSSEFILYEYSKIKYLFGELRDSSQLNANHVYEMNLKTDSLSNFDNY